MERGSAQMIAPAAQEHGVELQKVWAKLAKLPPLQREALLLWQPGPDLRGRSRPRGVPGRHGEEPREPSPCLPGWIARDGGRPALSVTGACG